MDLSDNAKPEKVVAGTEAEIFLKNWIAQGGEVKASDNTWDWAHFHIKKAVDYIDSLEGSIFE